MENEIKVNEFVRYKDGDIIQIFQKIDREYVIKDNKGRIYTLPESAVYKRIVKHSPNLIDLIQYGDYVNGQEVETVYGYDEDGNDKDGMGICEVEDDYAYYKYLEDINITTIVTKEMMESIIYKVKE